MDVPIPVARTVLTIESVQADGISLATPSEHAPVEFGTGASVKPKRTVSRNRLTVPAHAGHHHARGGNKSAPHPGDFGVAGGIESSGVFSFNAGGDDRTHLLGLGKRVVPPSPAHHGEQLAALCWCHRCSPITLQADTN
jgi:hypothetical protein